MGEQGLGGLKVLLLLIYLANALWWPAAGTIAMSP